MELVKTANGCFPDRKEQLHKLKLDVTSMVDLFLFSHREKRMKY